MPRGVWKVLLWTSLAMLFRCCGALSSGRLSVVLAPKPEPSLWWSLYGGEATKALGFYCRFKRNVWHRADAKGGLKSAPVGPKPEFSIADSGATFDIGRMPTAPWMIQWKKMHLCGATASSAGFYQKNHFWIIQVQPPPTCWDFGGSAALGGSP